MTREEKRQQLCDDLAALYENTHGGKFTCTYLQEYNGYEVDGINTEGKRERSCYTTAFARIAIQRGKPF